MSTTSLGDPAALEPRAPVPGFYASWGRRFAAWSIDAVLIVVLATAPSLAVPGYFALGALLVVPPVYVVGFTGGPRGQTPGKRLLGIAVRHRESLGRLGYGAAFARWLVTAVLWWLFVVPALIDALWPLFDRENRALHDRAAGSVVIRL